MSNREQAIASKLATGLADNRVSPAVLALQLTREGVHVNEAFLTLITNYIILMARKELIPMNMKAIYDICKALEISLQELGLTGLVGNSDPLDMTEYLVV